MANYNKLIMEPYALDVLTTTYDKSYSEYSNYDENGFDFESEDREKVLEVTIAMTDSQRSLLEYEKSFDKKGIANKSRVINPVYYGNMLVGINGDISEKVNAIKKKIEDKDKKREGKSDPKIELYELCILLIEDRIMDTSSLMFINDYIRNSACGFNKIFMVFLIKLMI